MGSGLDESIRAISDPYFTPPDFILWTSILLFVFTILTVVHHYAKHRGQLPFTEALFQRDDACNFTRWNHETVALCTGSLALGLALLWVFLLTERTIARPEGPPLEWTTRYHRGTTPSRYDT
jgi:hypothetical protein